MSPEPTRIATWKKAVFSLLVLGLVVGGSEIGLRSVGWGPAYRADFAGWRMPGDLRDHLMNPPGDPHRFRVDTNRDGLRTQIPEARTDGVFRLAVMGDSTVFGWGVDEGEDLPSRLEAHLRAAGARVEVLNAAQPGYTTAQLVALHESTIHRWQPDLVLLLVPQHDHTPALVSDWEHYEGSGGPLSWMRVMLARHSRIYHLLWTRIGGVPGPDAADEVTQMDPGIIRVPRVSDAERNEAVDRIRSSQAEWGGALALGLMPAYPDLAHTPESPGGDGPHVPWHRTYAADRDVPLVDVRHCCGPDADSLVFPFDKWHLNARGNDEVARALATGLTGLGVFSP